MSTDEKSLVLSRIREWAKKPQLNVHRIIGIVVRAGGTISRDQLVRETEQITKSKNAHGAIAILLTSKANAYGRIFEDRQGLIRIHPELESEVRANNWS